PYGALLMKITNLNASVVSVFANTPFASMGERGALHARIMVSRDGASVDDIRKLGSYYACEGFDRIKMFSTRPLSEHVINADYPPLGGPPPELHDLPRSATPAVDFCRG